MKELMETKNPLFIIYITLPPSSPATSIRIVWLYIPSWITLLLSIHHALHISMVSHPNAWFLFQMFLPTHIILFHTRGNSLAVTATDTISGSLYLPNIKWLTHVDIRKYVTKTLHGLWDFKACILTHSLWQNINENETGVQATILFSFFLLRNFSHDMHVHSCVAINFRTETGQYIANDNSEAWESRCHLLLLACTDGTCGSLQPKNIPKCILNRHG